MPALSFIGVPILFCAIGYLILYLSVGSLLGTAMSFIDLAFLQERPQHHAEYQNIFEEQAESRPDTGKLKASEITVPGFGDQFGKLTIEGTQVDAKLFFGDSNQEFKNGVGVYNGSGLPGYGKTVLIGGHNNTFFHDLGSAREGAVITVETNYGTYRYEITESKVLQATDQSAYDLEAAEENIVLYTCYPFDALGLTQERYFVYGSYLSGPQIDLYE